MLRDRVVAAKRAARDIRAAAQQQVARRQSALGAVSGRLHALSPLATLARGYAVARDANGATLGGIADFGPDMPFELIVRDGVVQARANPGNPA